MSRLQSQIRLIVSYGLGAFFLAESLNPNFWRPHIQSLSPLIHVFVAIFGASCGSFKLSSSIDS